MIVSTTDRIAHVLRVSARAAAGRSQVLRRRLAACLAARCLLCEQAAAPDAEFCAGCRADFFDDAATRCRCCALRLSLAHIDPDGALCGRCLHAPPAFDATITATDYAAPVDGLIKALKYGGRTDLGGVLGLQLAHAVRRAATAIDARTMVVPMPLSFERWTQRGYNQAVEIGRAAAAALGLTLYPAALLRVRHTPAQEGLSLVQRRRNLRAAIVARTDLSGRTVALVDDVMTSGATLDEAARAARQAGAGRVVNWVVARTP